MGAYLLLIVGAALVNNLILWHFLGACPFLGVSRDARMALRLGGATTFVITCASALTWAAHHYVLVPLHVAHLQTVVFVILILVFVRVSEMALHGSGLARLKALGIYFPLLAANCAVLGVALLNVRQARSFLQSVAFGFGASLGFALALVIFSGLREKIERSDPPKAFRGLAIALVTAGLLSLAFMGFAGLVRK